MQEQHTHGFTYPLLLVFLFICFSIFIFMLDYNQVLNIKDTVDKEFKKSISSAMITHIDDQFSTDRVATLEEEDKKNLQTLIKSLFQSELETKYNINVAISEIHIDIDDIIVVKYKGTVKYKPLGWKTSLDIPVKGRSKAQRFDVE